MKRLVLVGEGHGECSALSTLARKILNSNANGGSFFVDHDIVRAGGVPGLVKWDHSLQKADFTEWNRKIKLASKRRDVAGVIAIFDGDCPHFPAGSRKLFCPVTAARQMAAAASETGAGATFSLAVVFACKEYESWLIASIESIAGKSILDRPAYPTGLTAPEGDPQSHGKRWLEKNISGYRPTRDQNVLTELLDLSIVRGKNVRSFARLETAVDQVVNAANAGVFVCTPNHPNA